MIVRGVDGVFHLLIWARERYDGLESIPAPLRFSIELVFANPQTERHTYMVTLRGRYFCITQAAQLVSF